MAVLEFCPIWDIFQGLTGGTTVSATMIAAHRAGIPVFVTGGIGGVHRNGENSKHWHRLTSHFTGWHLISRLLQRWPQKPDFRASKLFTCSSGHQCRPDGAQQDSHRSGFCWSQVYSGHRAHSRVPGQSIHILLPPFTEQSHTETVLYSACDRSILHMVRAHIHIFYIQFCV